MSDFTVFRNSRRLLQDFCRLHVASVMSFRAGISFRINPGEVIGGEELRHLTSTATCWESLLKCPVGLRTEEVPTESAQKFAQLAIEYNPPVAPATKTKTGLPTFDDKKEKWKSDGSARVYCRCRALPFVINCLSEWHDNIKAHLAFIVEQLTEVGRFGVGEADSGIDPHNEHRTWYAPNAYHTYWTLAALRELKKTRFESSFGAVQKELDLERREAEMLLWARRELGYQIGLHTARSSLLDTDQLAWSLAIFIAFENGFQSHLAHQDFIKQALECLFSTQTDIGTWRHYAPLFHYRNVGDAYCYVFETFAVLLSEALTDRAEGEFLRSVFRPHAPKLLKLWEYALSTQISDEPAKLVTWASGHRMHKTDAESWATASVFAYTQALRRLVGVWCRDEAKKLLNRPSGKLSAVKARQTVLERGDNWRQPGNRSVGERLLTMFINPTTAYRQLLQELEPDSQPIEQNQARSAIMFGPPGASKTSLAQALAAAINWDYVEIHASHFVAEGLPNVQKRADEIFDRLGELDRTVVLFDEIDELVRSREATDAATRMDTDAFGRFLTTSMLPKLAELWKKRKIIYFVATNHIEYFDEAVTRSQRFDALLLVSPPTFQRKVDELKNLIKQIHTEVSEVQFNTTEREVSDQLASAGRTSVLTLQPSVTLAKFALLRWDELPELAHRIMKSEPEITAPNTVVVSTPVLVAALDAMSDQRLSKPLTFTKYVKEARYERRDFNAENVWRIDEPSALPEFSEIKKLNGVAWLVSSADDLADVKIPGHSIVETSAGVVRVRPAAPRTKKASARIQTKRHQ